MDALELELRPQRRELVEEELEAPVDVGRPVGAPAAELVVDDDLPTVLGELLERREVVVCRAGPAVQAEQGILSRLGGADDAIPGAVPAKIGPSFVCN